MAQPRTDFEDELEQEDELETEWEQEGELEGEDEAFFGGLAKIAGSLLGEGEDEAEEELEGEYEDEFEAELEAEWEAEDELEAEHEDEWEAEDEYESSREEEAFLGGLASMAGSLLGEGEEEYEDEAEQFFKRIGRAFKKGLPFIKKLAKTVGPLVATAVGGPAAGMLARAVTSQLEGELEGETEAELEDELEAMGTAPVTGNQAFAEYLAAQASTAPNAAEAEAMAGSAVTVSLSARDRRDLEQMLPHLVRGAAALTRVLHADPGGRPAIRLVPSIASTTARTVLRRRGAGVPMGPAAVGPIMAATAARVLGHPRWRSYAARRHARGLAYSWRRRHGRGGARHRHLGHARNGSHPRRRGGMVRRAPARVRTVGPATRVTRPRSGFVRVVTPVRVPPRGGRPARTVRVVSDVRVPSGARPAGRPSSVAASRRR